MYLALIVIHIIFAILLIVVVLLQSGGKGASMGAIFGGAGSQTLFGSSGPAGFLSKVTTVVAIMFMLTSLSIAIISAKKSTSSIVTDKVPPNTTQQAPSIPEPINPLPKTQKGAPPPTK
jgi:preprotein translocase subunit SecG